MRRSSLLMPSHCRAPWCGQISGVRYRSQCIAEPSLAPAAHRLHSRKLRTKASMDGFTGIMTMGATALCLVVLAGAPGGSHAAVVCEAGKGYVAADTAQQVNENFLAKS